MTEKQKKFVSELAKCVQEFAPQYGILVHSPIIAQGILESAWGESKLAKKYHNYFGLKCGSKWQGASVNLRTKEEYYPGVITNIIDNFRVYSSMREGVKGYFDFLGLTRYQNLRGVTDPAEYLRLIKSDGFATASNYVSDCMAVVDKYDLTKYDSKKMTEKDITLLGHGSGNPTLHNLYTYTTRRNAQKAPNGLKKGIVAVRRPKAIKTAQAAKFREVSKVTIGRNKYSQDRREYVYKAYKNGVYYSDCSAIGIKTLEKLGLKFSWTYNTAAIYENKEFETVPVKIKDGHITNPELLRVGDAVLYRGNDPDRPKQIGHVEWVYEIPEEKTGETYPGEWPVLDNGRSGRYYQYGDGITTLTNYPTQIRRLQRLLNWLDDSTADLEDDGKFGSLTEKKVNVCRKMFGLKENGRFDSDLLNAAKSYRK